MDKNMSIKIKNAAKWSMATEVLAKLIAPITNLILARLLVPEDFGVISTITMITSFLDIIAVSGFGQYLIYNIFDNEKEYQDSIDVAFWSNLLASLFIWLLIIIFSEPLASIVGNSGHGNAFSIACISLPFVSFASIPSAILQKKYDYKGIFYNRLVGSLMPLFVTIPLATMGFKYWSIIIGNIVSNIIKAALLLYKSKWRPKLFFSFSILKNMLSYSSWILLESIMMWGCTWIDIFLIGREFGSYYTGLYRTTQTTINGIITIVTTSFSSIAFVTLSKLQDDNEKFKSFFYNSQRLLAIMIIPMGVGIFIFSDTITQILLGSQWTEAAEFLGIWGLSLSLAYLLGTFCREALRAKGNPKLSMWIQMLHLIFIVIVIMLSLPNGYRFLIYARSIAYFQIILLFGYYMKKILEISPIIMFKNIIWTLISAILMGVFGTIIKHLLSRNIFIDIFCMILCCIFYFLILILNKNSRKDVISLLHTIIK